MAKRVKKQDDEQESRSWREGELIKKFNLQRISMPHTTPLMQEWLDTPMLNLNIHEQYNFDKALEKAQQGISGWNEEDLKMKFISPVLE